MLWATITPRMGTGHGELERWQDMGVSRLILLQRGEERSALLDNVRAVADALIR